MKAQVFVLFILSLNFNLIGQSNSNVKIDKELQELHELMQGSFNSLLQSQQDSSYYNISLHMHPIWNGRGYFLYVEQALNSVQDKPYRQRVYEITRIDSNTFRSTVYTLADEKKWIGKWKSPKEFNMITKSDLVLRTGCEVILKRLGEDHFKGSTGANSCESSLKGASYATSEVEIKKGTIVSWDKGMDEDGNQVWGAEKGGYIFIKLNSH